MIALTALLSAIQVISTFIPIDKFIGGAGFITLEIVIIPLIAFLLEPWQAFVSALIGGVIGFFVNAALGIGLGPVFGPVSILVAPIAAYLGSVTFHFDKSWFKWSSKVWIALPLGFMGFGTLFYLTFAQGTVLWLVPYGLAILALLYRPWAKRVDVKIAVGCFSTAMCWQVGLNVVSVSILGLVGPVWGVITPFMYFERTVATVGSLIIIQAVLRTNNPLVSRIVS